MKESARYAKIVEWCGREGGVRGACQVVEEAIALYHKEGKPLPPPTSGRDFANNMQNVA
jgi:hypothetical protein